MNPNEPQMHFIEVGEKVVHAIPCYNVDDVNVRQYTDFFVEKGGITGILPVKQLSSSKVSDLIKIKRPSAATADLFLQNIPQASVTGCRALRSSCS